jgi:hypothetical protein
MTASPNDSFLRPPPGSLCQEASLQSHAVYIPCAKAAEVVVENRDECLPMCLACADHSVKNRGARYVIAKSKNVPLVQLWPNDATLAAMTERFIALGLDGANSDTMHPRRAEWEELRRFCAPTHQPTSAPGMETSSFRVLAARGTEDAFSGDYLSDEEVRAIESPFDEDDVEPAPPPSDEALRSVKELALSVGTQRRAIEDARLALTALEEALRRTEEVDLPQAMAGVGLTDFSLLGGGKVVLKTDYHASLKASAAASGFRVLAARGAEDLIKRDVTAKFPRAVMALPGAQYKGWEIFGLAPTALYKPADVLVAIAKKMFRDAKISDKEHVHPGTLSAYVREEVKSGRLAEGDPDFAALGVYVRRWAKVDLPGAEGERQVSEEEAE